MAKIRIENSFKKFLVPYFLMVGVGILLTSLSLLLSCAVGKSEPPYYHVSSNGDHAGSGGTASTAGTGGKGYGGSTGSKAGSGGAQAGGSGGSINGTPSGGSSGTGNDPLRADSGSASQSCEGQAQIHLAYQGPAWSGTNSLYAWWIPPGQSPTEWSQVSECLDSQASDGKLDCTFHVPHCVESLEFQVNLPYGRFWGDLSCGPNGGCGQTLGTVSLDIQGTNLIYELQSNGVKDVNCTTGCDPYPYKNGIVDYIP